MRVAVTAVILAAGRGSRLGAGSKPLAIVGGLTLLERAVATARAAGIGRIVVVVDALDGAVASFCRSNVPGVEVAGPRITPAAMARRCCQASRTPAVVV